VAVLKIKENELVNYVRKYTSTGNKLRIEELLTWTVERFSVNRQYASSFITKLCQDDRFYKSRLIKNGRYVEVVK